VVGRHVRIVASVEAIDAKASKVTLRGPKRTVDLKVKDPANLKDVKVGDMVEAEFAEAFAIKVEKAK
jgi:Cu/Ag efflux protein CusF